MKVGIRQPHGYGMVVTLTGVWYGDDTYRWEYGIGITLRRGKGGRGFRDDKPILI